MMKDSDFAYLTRRFEQERALEATSVSEPARRAHEALAGLYHAKLGLAAATRSNNRELRIGEPLKV